MRRGRILIYLGFVIILILVGYVVIWQRFLKPATPKTTAVTPTPVQEVNVVFVTQRVSRGGILTRDVLKEFPYPKDRVIEGMYKKVEEVLGRQAKIDLDAGMPLMPTMLISEGEQLSQAGSIASLSIPRGMVAVSLKIDDLSSVSYAIKPGDHVNVIVTLLFVDLDSDFQTLLPDSTGSVLGPQPPVEGAPAGLTAVVSSGGGTRGRAEIDPVLGQTIYLLPNPNDVQRPRMSSQTLLQDAVVLHVGEFPQKEVSEAKAGATPAAGQPATAPTATPAPVQSPGLITLIVTPQDAVTLNYLLSMGQSSARIALALRAAKDDSRTTTESVTLQYLLDTYRIPVPVKLPYGLEPPGRALPTLTPPKTNENK